MEKKHNSPWHCCLWFCSVKSLRVALPLPNTAICDFTAWALKHCSLKPSTVKSYVSSLSSIHEVNGFAGYNCLSPTVKRIIQGAQNLQFYEEISKCTRKVMSLPLLKLTGHVIAKASWDPNSKQVIWTACVVALCGSFKLGKSFGKKWMVLPHNGNVIVKRCEIYKTESVLIHGQVKNLATQNVPILTSSSSTTIAVQRNACTNFMILVHGLCKMTNRFSVLK